jgi:hypothetical protein
MMAASVGTYSCAVALPVKDSKHDLKSLVQKSEKRVGTSLQSIKKGFHVSLAEFSAPSLAIANKINSLVLSEVQKARPFDITTYNGHAEWFRGPKKDYVVLSVKVLHRKKNKAPHVLVDLSKRVNSIITKNGGHVLFPVFKPHITLGKVFPKGQGARLPSAKKKFCLAVDPKLAFAFKPFQMSAPQPRKK